MDDRWFYRSNGQAEGPYNSVQIRQLAASGVITAETPLRQGEDGRWLRADHISGIIKSVSAKPMRTATPLAVAAAPPAKPATVRAKPAAPPPAAMAKPAPAKVRAVGAAPAVVRAAVIPAAPAPLSVAEGRHQRRRQNPLPLIAAVVIVGILLIGGGAATIIAFVAIPLATEGNDTKVATTTTVAATNPAPADAAQEDADSQQEKVNASAASRATAVAGVKSWKPVISKQGAKGGVKSSKMQVKFDTAWLGDDAHRDVGGPELVETKEQSKLLFVRLLITNVQNDQPLEYRGWNKAGEETEAILIDEAGDFAELVPLADASAKRLSDVSIAPKANATDVLVFAISNSDFEHMRLALPFPGIGYCGFQIDQAMLAKPGQPANPSEIAKQPDADDPILGNPPAADEPAVEEETPEPHSTTPEPTAEAPPAEDAPPDLDELQRSIAEEAGETEEPKDAGDEPKR